MNEPGAAAGVVKRSLTIAGHRTSVSLEDAFWTALRTIAHERQQSLAALVAEIDGARGAASLSSTIRLFVLEQSRYGSRPAP